MFKTKGGAGGQRLFEQCSKKLRIWYRLAPLTHQVVLGLTSDLRTSSLAQKTIKTEGNQSTSSVCRTIRQRWQLYVVGAANASAATRKLHRSKTTGLHIRSFH